MPKDYPTKILPSVEYLRECFSYDPAAGSLTWKHRPRKHFPTARGWAIFNSLFAGTIAGTPHNAGYWHVHIINCNYLAHRLIWKLVTSKDPPNQIDHKDHNKRNNKWSNLRLATQSEQNHNSKLHSHNTTGYRGIYRYGKKWRAKIIVNNIQYHLGTFTTAKKASTAYQIAARKIHGEFYYYSKSRCNT